SGQVRRATFPQVLRGYDRDAVHDLLDRVADWMEGKAGSDAGATPAVRDEIAKVGERTAGILTAAEEAAANLRDEAKHYAVKIRADADEEVRKARLNASQRMDEMVADAEAKAQRIIDDAVARRRQLNQAISSLLERRDEIASEAARLADELMEAVDALRSPDTRDAPVEPKKVTAPPSSAAGSAPVSEPELEPDSDEVAVPEPEPTSDEIAMVEPESEEQPVEEPDSEETALFDVESETGDEEVVEEDSEETKIFEPDTADLPQGPSKLLVDPDEEDETPPSGLPR
ncbi:MAG TPA: DivIVA domain-containing protein, partial [Solirubrobacterales bacterium]|nr:DivIVA domain-containing protein [Solirubrobacterales bacterium]